ncbi:FliA/WhiG family RNA polymerase sigma factor [Desulfoluna spongiiphila]|uniref:RNA polymerase sigma factor n=1 Tax=Desulfoluna spongiiphila TaxID=419481 RepID=A0A1G5AJL7_9BACT|nr:FliA/WhiG family RNA polymerase sigma factor [Desulfoluna spongiiphila]SCX78052.1 RNA polymerase sigma factor for flagellar operon FliA [Desulfoluna spongiiphila]VVS90534.1 rna polymerase sigma-70 [Desulfoluna spongiiphila]
MTSAYEKKIEKRRCHFSPLERDEMIRKYAYLVKYIAGRVASRLPANVAFDELVSAGSLGLIDAVDKFDPEKDVGLKTYAQYRIKGAILDELRSMDWYSRSMRKKIQDVEAAVQKIEARKERPASDLEVAEELGMPLEKYYKTLSDIHSAAILSLDACIRNDDSDEGSGSTFSEGIRSEDDPSDSVMKKELKQVLIEAIQRLTDKEQTVISLYYYEEMTLKEIGKIMDLTESRICQIHTQSLIKLRSRIRRYQK